MYIWKHLKDTKVREKFLFEKIKSFLKPSDRILDFGCGFSPLARPLLMNNYRIIGIDENEEAIEYLKKNFPNGNWILSSVEKYYNIPKEFINITVLVQLGIGAFETKKYQEFLENFLTKVQPRVLVLETALGPALPPAANKFFIEPKKPWLERFNNTVKTAIKCKYVPVAYESYNSNIEPIEDFSSIRFYIILTVSNR